MGDASYVEFVEDQLQSLGDVTVKRMFGGFGLYRGTVFFGIISGGRLYFKVDERTKREYIDRGMGPFRATPKQILKTYYEVPVDVLEDDGELTAWAKEAIRCQRDTKRNPKRSPCEGKSKDK